MSRASIIAARRTAVVARNGAFASCDIHDLASPVIQAVLQDAGVAPDQVDELILSNALGAGGNPARVAALATGLNERVAGLSIDRQCCGGLDAILLAQAMVLSGQHEIVLAGGAESYSRRPLRLKTFADGRRPVKFDQAAFTPWADRDPDMAQAADQLATRLGVARQEQDAWAMNSHAKAMAWQETPFAPDIVDVLGQTKDPFSRKMSDALCARASIVSGSISAANMAVAADGAAFCLVVSDRVARRLGGRRVDILSGKTVGADPSLPGLAPIDAIKSALLAANVSVNDLSVAEIMEAFAVQAIACQKGAAIAPEIVNQNGGALARGHPIGASGAILAVRLFHALCDTKGIGLAAIAAAGGLGSAAVFARGD